ncbi:major facilitator superfamily transporter [Purpureocillium lilacinum]|uniref:Major facilitator superfamily transporter n=1 Tax=Purpureocillium lilacinum TaxID=33203 RepID=A0A179H6C8_PURLI|nr:major facilitator superfamily transporter [Purpureocillium lilacinum]OAQ85160.1 major facilitator superfamily transporter [Purpureocillium lilacinum]
METKNDVPLSGDTSSNVEGQVLDNEIDPIKERRVVRKLDLFITPVCFIVYLSCFIDRANIGNVKVAGMPKEIGATVQQFSTAVSIFYATYVPVEIPMVILSKRYQPRNLLTVLCVIWSVTTIANGLIHNVSVGGLLAYGLLQMNGVAGMAGWRWVYIIEGIFSILCVFAVWFGLPRDIRKAYFFTADDREVMELRHRERLAYLGSDEFDWNEIKLAFCDVKVWLCAATQFCQNTLTYGFSTFLPSILFGMGYDQLASNYLTIPVYTVGALGFFAFAYLSDRYKLCGPLILSSNVLGIIGYAILIGMKNDSVKYFACYFIAIAVHNGTGLNLAWMNVNVAPQYRRATSIGIHQAVGNSAGAVAGQIYRTAPYVLGNSFSLGAILVAEMLITAHLLYLHRCNKEREQILSGKKLDTRKKTTGDREASFVYRV